MQSKKRKVNISELTNWKKNPRKISRQHLEKLKESLIKEGEFTYKKPLFVNEKDGKLVVYAGNQRLKAMKELGWKEAWCEIEKDMPEEKMSKEAIIDNTSSGEWVIGKIKELKLSESFLDRNKLRVPEDFDEKGEIQFTEEIKECHNYIVLFYDNEVDWLQAQELFDLKPVKGKRPPFKGDKLGVGRVLKGGEAMNKVMNKLKV